MKILIDMNLPPKLADLLIEKGIEAKHWHTIGPAYTTDTDIIEYASSNNYIIMTYDLDFSAILSAAKSNKPSVIQIRAQKIKADEIADLVHAALMQSKDDMEDGAILTVDTKKSRLRILPL